MEILIMWGLGTGALSALLLLWLFVPSFRGKILGKWITITFNAVIFVTAVATIISQLH